MDDQKGGNQPGTGNDAAPAPDMLEGTPHIGVSADEFEEQVRIEMHQRGRRQERDHHIDLTKEEYAPDEIARMLGTSLEVVMHAIWHGELKADRHGRDVVCVSHANVVDWLRRRGPGV